MATRIAIIQGHPSAGGGHYGHALADAYARGAAGAGYQLRRIEVAELDFPILRTGEDWTGGAPPPAIREAQETIAWAEHLVILYPLWLGTMPALVYRWYFGGHSLKSLERNILAFSGIHPNRATLVGRVESMSDRKRQTWLGRLEALGREGA
jgi:putative NADPH-quinone reductase